MTECALSAAVARMLTDAVSMVPALPQRVTAELGMRHLLQYVGALGRFGDTPFIAPMYGYGELPQAFCRSCAVHGGIYMLNTFPEAIQVVDDAGGIATIKATASHEAVVSEDTPTLSRAVIAVSMTSEAAPSAEADKLATILSPSQASTLTPLLALRLSSGNEVRTRRVLAGPKYRISRSWNSLPTAGKIQGRQTEFGFLSRKTSQHCNAEAVVGTMVLITDAPVRAFLATLRGVACPSVDVDAASSASNAEVFSIAAGVVCGAQGNHSRAATIVQQGPGMSVCPDGYYVVYVRVLLSRSDLSTLESGPTSIDSEARLETHKTSTLRADAVAAARMVADYFFPVTPTADVTKPLHAGDRTSSSAKVLWRCSFSAVVRTASDEQYAELGSECTTVKWIQVPGLPDDRAHAVHDDDVAGSARHVFDRLTFPGAVFFAAASSHESGLTERVDFHDSAQENVSSGIHPAATAMDGAVPSAETVTNETVATSAETRACSDTIVAPGVTLQHSEDESGFDIAEALALLHDADF